MEIDTLLETEEPRIQSLARADTILSAVMNNREAMPLSKLTETLGLNKTTVFNLAESLVVLGFLMRTVNPKGYKLGLRCLELGRQVSKNLPILELSRPVLHELCKSTEETVNLAMPYFQEVFLAEALQSQHGVRATTYAGARSNYHSTACGKVLLAFFPDERREWILNNIELTNLTQFTITDRVELEQQLEDIRDKGFATEEQENELGASCVAAPIFGPFEEVIASISVAGVVHRMSLERVSEISSELTQRCAQLSRDLIAK